MKIWRSVMLITVEMHQSQYVKRVHWSIFSYNAEKGDILVFGLLPARTNDITANRLISLFHFLHADISM